MHQWLRGSASGTALVIAGLLVGASAVAAPAEPTDPSTPAAAQSVQLEAAQDDELVAADLTTVLEPTADPTESEEPTQGPTDDPAEPTIEPTEVPTAPTEEPTEDPTVEPTDEPTVEPTQTPTEDPTSHSSITDGGITDPWAPVEQPGLSRAPVFAPIPTITAQSRTDVSEADLWDGVRVLDDVDLRLSPTISDWGDWFSAAECPGGYPCTYRILYLVTDSDGNAAEAMRSVVITGREAGVPAVQVNIEEAAEQTVEERSRLPLTGIGSWGIFGFGALLLTVGTGLIISSRRSPAR